MWEMVWSSVVSSSLKTPTRNLITQGGMPERGLLGAPFLISLWSVAPKFGIPLLIPLQKS